MYAVWVEYCNMYIYIMYTHRSTVAILLVSCGVSVLAKILIARIIIMKIIIIIVSNTLFCKREHINMHGYAEKDYKITLMIWNKHISMGVNGQKL